MKLVKRFGLPSNRYSAAAGSSQPDAAHLHNSGDSRARGKASRFRTTKARLSLPRACRCAAFYSTVWWAGGTLDVADRLTPALLVFCRANS